MQARSGISMAATRSLYSRLRDSSHRILFSHSTHGSPTVLSRQAVFMWAFTRQALGLSRLLKFEHLLACFKRLWLSPTQQEIHGGLFSPSSTVSVNWARLYPFFSPTFLIT